MINYPEAQRKAQEELDRVIGSDRLITMDDKKDLPYISAFVNETQRLVNVLPSNLAHQTTRDVVVEGYRIPKGTAIIPQIAAVLHDETVNKSILESNSWILDLPKSKGLQTRTLP
jgi:cytochrome P450 family 33